MDGRKQFENASVEGECIKAFHALEIILTENRVYVQNRTGCLATAITYTATSIYTNDLEYSSTFDWDVRYLMHEISSLKTVQCNHDVKLIFQAKSKLQSGSQFVSDNLHLDRKPIYAEVQLTRPHTIPSAVKSSWVMTKNRGSFSIHCQSGYAVEWLYLHHLSYWKQKYEVLISISQEDINIDEYRKEKTKDRYHASLSQSIKNIFFLTARFRSQYF